MADDKQKDRFDKTESWIRIFKELGLVAVIVMLIVIAWPALPKWATQIRSLDITGAELVLKATLKKEVSDFAQDNVANILQSSAGTIPLVDVVIKGSPAALANARDALHRDPTSRFDVLQIQSGSVYTPELLRLYMAQLNVKYVIFTRQHLFEGIIDAPVLVAQLQPGTDTYEELKQLAGVTEESVRTTDSIRHVLERMNGPKVSRMAVLNEGRFQTVITREELVSRVMTEALLKSPGT